VLDISHNPLLVLASIAMVLMAGFTGLSLTRGASAHPVPRRKLVVAMSAIALGGGIWSMHFMAMLGLQLPFPFCYNALITLMSALVAILLAGLALLVLHFRPRSPRMMLLAGSILGVGIALMHFVGMLGMQVCRPVNGVADYVLSTVAVIGLASLAIGVDTVTIGAMVTQHELIAHTALRDALSIIREAALQIADPQVRYVGTEGGNVANGGPGNDMPGFMQCRGATYEIEGADCRRTVPAREFYQGAYFTTREDEEILTRVHIPRPASGTGYAYEKQMRKIGDHATAAAAVLVGGGMASVTMTNLSDTPIWGEDAGTTLISGDVEGCVAAMLNSIGPVSDNRDPVEFKTHVASVILRRAFDRPQSRVR
jgi:carbon-monoxide dehydrogenase medium subunit